MTEITTQNVYPKDVERLIGRYGKPFPVALSKALDALDELEEAAAMTLQELADSMPDPDVVAA